MTNPLLHTKFYVPSIRPLVVKRARLIEKLNYSMECKLTLISAPAGFGKTTLLSEWLHQTNKPICWLSLDEADNDITRFFTYFTAALQQIQKNIGSLTLYTHEFTTYESLLITLINEIAKLKQDIILVLDDYHLITNHQIHEALNFLLEHLPIQLHLAIASRVEPPLPLARLRANNQLIEIQGADLCFNDNETALFFNQVMNLPLTNEQIQEIHARTEGWIAGLQLAALSIRDASDISKFIESFKGSQRHILDYLVEEVLEQQTQPIQSVLLKTSILEQICGALVEAVIGENELNGTDILEYLENRNLFIVPLDNERQWYRYHHLFRELLYHLLNRRQPQSILEYHHRAAQWYKNQGLAPQAIQHAIASQEFTLAADLIEKEIQSANNPRFEAVRLRTWLETLPREMVWTRPWLLLSYMWALYSLGQFGAAAVALQSMEPLLKQQQNSSLAENETLWGLITAFKGVLARATGEMLQSSALIEQGLQQLPRDDSWLRAMVLLNLGVTYFVADNYAAASKVLSEVTRIGQFLSIPDPAIAPLYLQAQFLALRGQMDKAMHYCQQGVDLAQARDWLSTYAGVLVKVAYSELLREQNQLETAAQHLTESIERGIKAQQPGVMMGYITLARVQEAQGNSKAAWEAISCAEQCQIWMWPTILSVAACKARLNLLQGNLDEAIAWAENSGLSVDGELRYSFTDSAPCGSELDYLTLARVLLARGRMAKREPYLDDAIRLLTRLYNFAASGGRTARVMEILILQALVWQARSDIKRALCVLETAINIPHQGDYIRIFLDEGKPMIELLHHAASNNSNPKYINLLTACGIVEDKFSVIEPLIEPLSEREIEVLHYLATGLSNQAIAEKLFVSLAAVKWHARNIYGKLNASNRTEAVYLARQLEILK